MSLIRKPGAAEQVSPLRRAAEAGLESSRQIRDVGRATGQRVGRGVSTVASFWLLGVFTFGALTASGLGAKLFGLVLLSPFYYWIWRKHKNRLTG